MIYRELLENEIDAIWNIDRTEFIEAVYSNQTGTLSEEKINHMLYGWPPDEDKIYGPILKDCFKRKGYFLGGFHDGILKAIVVLESKWIGKNRDTLQLKFLHIDQQFRGMGIGKVLFCYAVEKAQQLKAKRMYISSCENKNTVDFYKHLGCRITDEIEPELYAFEPNDIHMEFNL
jgi:predicted N-acetyltransferase YhbS